MKPTKSQKIYLGILGAAICALVWDQTTGSARPVTHPPTVPVPLDTAISVQPIANQSASAPKAEDCAQAIGLRLQKLECGLPPLAGVRDAFVPSTTWNPGGNKLHTVDQQAAEFRQAHHLKLVVTRPAGSMAMVDDDLMSVGQMIDGYQLRSVQKLSALFVNGGSTVELHINGSQPPAASAIAR